MKIRFLRLFSGLWTMDNYAIMQIRNWSGQKKSNGGSMKSSAFKNTNPSIST